MAEFWIILTGALVASCCGLLGCFLLLRRMTMVADAISHAVLPGIVIAYFIAGSRSSIPVLIGAAVFGMLVTVLIEVLHKYAKLQSDAAIGISFTWLFAVGVILISLFADQVDLDQDCVLYGEILYVPLDIWYLADGTNMGPRPVWLLGGLFICLLSIILFAYKPLLITSFDPAYATALGISTTFWHYAFMSAVSLTTVLSFESVGAILVIAFIIGPAASAYLLTDELPYMLLYAVVIGIGSSMGGFYLAAYINASIAGCMAVCVGVAFIFSFIYYRLKISRSKYVQAENQEKTVAVS